MTIPTDQQSKFSEFDVAAETLEDLEPDRRGSDGVRGGAMQPYLALPGSKSGEHKGDSVPPAQ